MSSTHTCTAFCECGHDRELICEHNRLRTVCKDCDLTPRLLGSCADSSSIKTHDREHNQDQ